MVDKEKSLSNDVKANTDNYKSAAKEIEQEKKMVTALKRLSIGNMMNFDPDLPPDDLEYQYFQSEDELNSITGNSEEPENALSVNRSPSKRMSFISIGSDTEETANSILSESQDRSDNDDNENSYDEDRLIDTETLIWLPANLHPEVNPEEFRLHFRSKVKELVERKQSRANRLSRHSSLSSIYSEKKEDGHGVDAPVSPSKSSVKSEVSSQTKRSEHSNPSLSKLTNQLETLSKLAGMESDDAVTIAKTLSKNALGYTEIEKQALDELTSPPNSPKKYEEKEKESEVSDADHNFEGDSTTVNCNQNDASEFSITGPPYTQTGKTGDFSLRRSRRHHYRQATLSHYLPMTGSSLQHNKADKLAELRNSLNTSILPEVLPETKSDKRKYSMSKNRDVRSSQLMFTYKDPNMLPLSHHSGDSPYPEMTSSHSPVELHFTVQRFGQHNMTAMNIGHGKSPRPEKYKNKHGIGARKHYELLPDVSKKRVERPRQPPPQNPRVLHQNKPVNRALKNLEQSRRAKPKHSISRNFHSPSSDVLSHENTSLESVNSIHSSVGALQQWPMQRESAQSEDYKSMEEKSLNLNDNLNQLRKEINTFKDSLTSIDASKSPTITSKTSDSEVENIMQDCSLQASLQNISYEDSLGIEKEVLQELNIEKDMSKCATSEPAEGILDSLDEIPDIPEPDITNLPSSKEDKSPEVNFLEDKTKGKGIQLTYAEELSLTSTKELSKEKQEAVMKSNDLNLLQKEISSAPLGDDYMASLNWLERKAPFSGEKTLKKKNSWSWLKEKSGSEFSRTHYSQARSVSNPEVSKNTLAVGEQDKSHEKLTIHGKENVISKFFRKKRSNSMVVSSKSNETKASSSPSGVTVDYESDSDTKKNLHTKIRDGVFKKRNKSKTISKASNIEMVKTPPTSKKQHDKGKNGIKEVSSIPNPSENNMSGSMVKEEPRSSQSKLVRKDKPIQSFSQSPKDGSKENDLKINQKDSVKKDDMSYSQNETSEIDHKQSTKVVLSSGDAAENLGNSRAVTLDIQEKIKKSIRRTSRANQPIPFTDSAFGFPLPPPSQSTLVMLHYRFPVNVERAIYRLSHLKLANPKRSLREQVLLSNFMYAYLNLVDHTLHLEQRMSCGNSPDENQSTQSEVENQMTETETTTDAVPA